MDSRRNEMYTDLPSVETPEDVAVLYSWANLHGAKYRDFSASRREYRAQLRHRAAEQARETELRAHSDAEEASRLAMEEVHRAEADALAAEAEAARLEALQHAEAAAQRASAERMEAARRAEAAAQAGAQARREQREIAEAHASDQRKQALYRDNLARKLDMDQTDEVPGSIADPYTPQTRQPLPQDIHHADLSFEQPAPRPRPESAAARLAYPDDAPSPRGSEARPAPMPIPIAPPAPPRRPQGYRPDDASGVRQIYRPGQESVRRKQAGGNSARAEAHRPVQPAAPPAPYTSREAAESYAAGRPVPQVIPSISAVARQRELAGTEAAPAWHAAPTLSPASLPEWQQVSSGEMERRLPPGAPFLERRRVADTGEVAAAPVAGETDDPTPRRRRQDQPGYRVTDSDRAIAAYRREQGQTLQASTAAAPRPAPLPEAQPRYDAHRAPEPVLPAWIHEQPQSPLQPPSQHFELPEPTPPAEFAAETLQRSRERVAARWYALKGVFDQGGQEQVEPPPQRQREIRTPVLAVFSFAGGVGKTSLVATMGRSLSSLGEKVLLTDTTSHGLLPFYFGASELRESTVRTFSPPSGSTDAPIYLVNYAVDQGGFDEATQDSVVDNIVENGRGVHRILLDLTSNTSWLIRRLAHTAPTVLVPLAPDMNSVISLQSIERFLKSIDGPDGTPLKVFYVLTQFDAGLPLHLDVREVLRRQLGERLLPVVIRRAPAVSEALAEGMTIIDYAADAPVAEDYLNVAQWLRTIAAPATAGFRNVRWSER